MSFNPPALPFTSPLMADLAESVVDASADRRRASRLPCRLSAVCWEEGQTGSTVLRARVQDASAGGVGLLVRRNIPAGTLLCVELRTPTGEVFGSMKCEVANCRPGDDGVWHLGCLVREGSILQD